jgi:hypothetical protein
MIKFGQLTLIEDQDLICVRDSCLQTMRDHQNRGILEMLEEVLQHALLSRSIDL